MQCRRCIDGSNYIMRADSDSIRHTETCGTVARKTKTQDTLSSFVVRPASVSRQRRLNDRLLKMIVQNLRPFSIVDDTGFCAFVAALEPSYSLPSRLTVSREWLPSIYCNAMDGVKAVIRSAEAVTLTTDS